MINGLDKLQRELDHLEKIIASLDGDITSVKFDPEDPQSIDVAIHHMEAAIDERVGNLKGNQIAMNLVSEVKENYRQAILDKAAEARDDGSCEE
ncbi:MAG: hypothetical protein ACX930_03700 [Erythrobacter sp.]